MILVVHTLSLKNPSDATLVSLTISIYPRWRPRWRTIISEKIVWYGKNVSKPICILKLLAMKLESSWRQSACNQININKNADNMAAIMADFFAKKYKKIFLETNKLQGFACKILIFLILELQASSL